MPGFNGAPYCWVLEPFGRVPWSLGGLTHAPIFAKFWLQLPAEAGCRIVAKVAKTATCTSGRGLGVPWARALRRAQ